MSSKSYAVVHANLLPMNEERVLYDQTVIVQNGRITEIGDAASAVVPVEAIQIDATGQYMLPTFADMHIHLEGQGWNIMFPPDAQFTAADLDFDEILFPYLANGITTVQVMSALPEHIVRVGVIQQKGPYMLCRYWVQALGWLVQKDQARMMQ